MIENKQILLPNLKFEAEPYIFYTPIKDVLLIQRPFFSDNRGGFQEQTRILDIENAIGRDVRIRQNQISESDRNVLRGIHFEPQDKITTPLTGKITAVLLDAREASATFKEWILFEVDNTQGGPRTTIFVPEGVGNSFCVHGDSPRVIYQYSATVTYDPRTAGMGVRFNDNDLKIPWPVQNPIVSDRDKKLPYLKEFLSARKNN